MVDIAMIASVGLLCLAALSEVTAVRVRTSSLVQTDQGVESVQLKCELSLENQETTYYFEWLKGKETVLERHSSGVVKGGESFLGRVSLGNGCSLLLSYPQMPDAGQYTIQVYSDRAEHNYDRGQVKLLVQNVPRQTKNDISTTNKTTNQSTSDQQTEEYLDWHSFVPFLVLSFVFLARYVFLVTYHMFVSRNCPQSMTVGRRRYHYPAVALILLTFAIAFGYSARGFITQNLSTYTVCSTAVIVGSLGLVAHDCYLQRRLYRITQQNQSLQKITGLLDGENNNQSKS